ncbi:MAG: rod shape-determining protein MreC [Acidobacteriaceae bacterium]|jgi:rod shape-determining protein MreC|nr:rod shape-determining protein MreC [Acidobacteriaceae bacterium]
MALSLPRLRPGYLFLVVVLAHVILISAQVNVRSGVPVLEAATFGFFSEVQRGASSIVDGVRNLWGGYVALRSVRAENESLRLQLADTEVQLQEERALAQRTRALEQLLSLRESFGFETMAAQIIAAGAAPDFRTVTIDRGKQDGVAADMAVITAGGVVGRVMVPGERASKVQLLVDHNAAAGALIERSRAQGVVVGYAGDLLRMDYVSEVSDVVVGDTVVTAGIDGIYPKGFVIGRVESVEKSGGAYRQILVKPSVDFSSIEDVLVVKTEPPEDPKR